LNGNSLVKDIYRLLPGSFISVSPEGIKIHPSDMGIRWGSEYHHMSLEETADLIIEISSEVLRNWIDHENINVSLSGGYDSRFLTLLALRHAKSIKAVNLGTKDWIDSKLAGQFCSAKDLSLEICSPPDHVSLAEYLTAIRMVEHTSDLVVP
jgi:asparagine synthetase B (glutamine-hydrolysing)